MDDSLSIYLVLVPALPLAAAILTGLLGPRVLRQQSHLPVIIAFLGAFVCSLLLLGEVRQRTAVQHQEDGQGFEHIVRLWSWADVASGIDGGNATGEMAGAPRFQIDIVLRADALTAVMLSMVTFVSTLVAIYAAGYMHGDRGFWRFFAYIGLFVFSMTMLVSVSNFVLLYVFWEAVGVCSYLLIGFWYQKPEAAAAGKKAFLVNRVGDFGFALALFLIWTTYGNLNFHDALSDGNVDPEAVAAARQLDVGQSGTDRGIVAQGVLGKSRIESDGYRGGTIATAICLLLMLGACGKSAQLPLHVWLPDAMEGPTPVSALIHAATMVTAGVYMVARCTPLFMVSPQAQLTVACVGAATALVAGLIALTQFDLKRVLAYSTVSQLGYMFLGLGVGTFAGITAGMFHLFTHAFFKALLFLGAGSVMHAMGNVIDMRRFGGLRKVMPITHATFFIGCLALAGIPGLAGFWSKDAIVAAVHDKVHELQHEAEHTSGDDHVQQSASDHDGHASAPHSSGSAAVGPAVDHQRYALVYQCLYWVAMFTAFLTVFYTFRACYLTFYGETQIPREAAGHAHESPPVMTWPLILLAVCAVVAGIAFDHTWRAQGTHRFAEFLAQTPSLAAGAVAETKKPYEFHFSVAATSGAIALAGWLLATYLYLRGRREINWLKSVMDFGLFSRNSDRAVWSPYHLSQRKFFVDELYYFTIVLPLR